MSVLALLPLLAQDEPASATVHAALVADLAERPQVRDRCCVCAEPGEHRGGHVLWPEGPCLCNTHYGDAQAEERMTGADFESAVAAVAASYDAETRAECEAAQ